MVGKSNKINNSVKNVLSFKIETFFELSYEIFYRTLETYTIGDINRSASAVPSQLASHPLCVSPTLIILSAVLGRAIGELQVAFCDSF